MDTREEMLELIRGRRAGFGLQNRFYFDPGFHALDLELIWYRNWLFIGHDCEIAEPGNYLTAQVGDYPVVIVRGRDGGIRAFVNACRHRGSRICSGERGTATRLVCPYHQWTYDLDGKLAFARQMGDGFDKTDYGLKPIACRSAGGFVFIHLADEPGDFAPFGAAVEPYLLPHRLADSKVACQSTIIEKGNWKLVWENNRECYHCAANHKELCKTYPEAPTMTGVTGVAGDPAMLAHWARCEAAGLPARFRADEAGQYRVTRAPLLRDAVSYTSSGESAVRKGLSDGVSIDRIGALLLYHYPTTWNHVLGDHAITFRVLPISATETAVTTKWLVHKDAIEGVDYDLDELIHVWTTTNDEDRRIVEEAALGIRAPTHEPGPYSQIHEGGVIQFVDWYADLMERRLCAGSRTEAMP
jgi:Rieske 2Fe-2S family protein